MGPLTLHDNLTTHTKTTTSPRGSQTKSLSLHLIIGAKLLSTGDLLKFLQKSLLLQLSDSFFFSRVRPHHK